MICRHYLRLAKLRLTALILFTTAVGFILGTNKGVGSLYPGRAAGSLNQKTPDPFIFLLVLLGTGLTATGASALNQLIEIDPDSKMRRTCSRPLPAGLISRPHAFLFAMLATIGGLGILALCVNWLTALLGLLNVLVYVLVYTPLKRRTPLSTPIGSICGALPPVMGWTAAAGHLSPEAAMLGVILFLWQVPHSLSLVWLHRDDYAAAGHRMLPAIDPSGRVTSLTILLYWFALMLSGVAATMLGLADSLFAAGSLVMGLVMVLMALQFHIARTERNARRIFLASIVYLPLLLLSLLADRC
jgi:heme o synthase